MKNLINEIDKIEEGTFRNRRHKADLNHTHRKWYRAGNYDRIKPIRAQYLVGLHVDDVVKKYVNHLPPGWRNDLRLLSYLGIDILARDGAMIDARGARYRRSSNIYTTQYYVNKEGVITENPKYMKRTWWHGVSYTNCTPNKGPHHLRMKQWYEERNKERKETRDKEKKEEERLLHLVPLRFWEHKQLNKRSNEV